MTTCYAFLGRQWSFLDCWTTRKENKTLYYTFGTKHYASAIDNELRPGVVNITSPANQEVDVIPYDSEPPGWQCSRRAISLYCAGAATRIRTLFICTNPPFPLHPCWLTSPTSSRIVAISWLKVKCSAWFRPSVEISSFEIEVCTTGWRTCIKQQVAIQTVLSTLFSLGSTERVIEAKSNEKEAWMNFIGFRKWPPSILEVAELCSVWISSLFKVIFFYDFDYKESEIKPRHLWSHYPEEKRKYQLRC